MEQTNKLFGRDSEKPLETSREWVDVTEYINNTCKDMKIGEMIHDHGFKIDRVMSAIEIMDPKMDTGLNYTKRNVETIEERIKNKTLPLKIKPRHCLEIMDRLLCTEATWYNGRYLTQSVFTCLYVTITEKIDFPYLRVYLMMFLKCCEHVHKLMEELKISGNVREDEEFYSRTYDNQIVFDFDIPKTIEKSIKLENSLTRRIEILKKKKSKTDNKTEDRVEEEEEREEETCPPLQSDPDLELFFNEALLYRLQYRRLVLQIHNVFCEERGIHQRVGELVPQSLSLLKKIRTQHRKQKIKSTEIVGFDPEYTRLIHRFIPQKPHPLLDFKPSCDHLEQYLSSLLRIGDLDNCRTIHDFSRFFRHFSMYKPNVIARSYCSMYFKGNNNPPPSPLLDEKLKAIEGGNGEEIKENQVAVVEKTVDLVEEEEENEGEEEEDGSGFNRQQLLCMNGNVHLGRLVERSFYRTYKLRPLPRKKTKKNDDSDDDTIEDLDNSKMHMKSKKELIVEELMKVREVKLICNQIGICFSIYFFYNLFNRPRQARKLKDFFHEHLKKVLFNSGVVDHSVNEILKKMTQKKAKHDWYFQYVYDLVLHTIRDVYMLQFELEVYSPDEYAPMFAYVDRLCSNLCTNIENMKKSPELGMEVDPKLSSHEQEVEKREIKTYRSEWEFKEKFYKMELLLARALFRMMVYLERAGHFTPPKYPFGTPEQRFKHRTRHFQKLTPPQRPFFRFEDYMEEKVQIVRGFPNNKLLLENVEKHLAAADTRNKQILKMKNDESGVGKCVWQMRKYFENLNKVLFANKLSLGLIKKLARGEKKTVVLDMAYGSFPVVKLKEPYKKK